MTERVLGSVRANVLCGDEEAGKETSEGESPTRSSTRWRAEVADLSAKGCGTARDDAWGGGEELR